MQEIADNGSNHFRFLELPRELQRKVITEAVIGFTTITLDFGYSEQCQCLLPVYRTTFPAALFLVSRLFNHDTKAVLAKDRGKIVELRSYLLWLYRDPPSASLKSFLIGVSTLRVQQLPLRQLKILVHALPNLRNVEASQPPFLEDYRPRLSKPIGLARNLFRGTSMMSVFSGEMDVVFAAEVQKEILQLMDPKDHIHLQNLCLKIPYRFRIKPIWSREWKDFMFPGPILVFDVSIENGSGVVSKSFANISYLYPHSESCCFAMDSPNSLPKKPLPMFEGINEEVKEVVDDTYMPSPTSRCGGSDMARHRAWFA